MKENEIIDENGNITTVRGDWLPLTIEPTNEDGSAYTFQEGDIIRFNIIKRKDCNCVEVSKDFEPIAGSTSIDIDMLASEMKFGEVISKPVDYWYEVILNPKTEYEQTIIGFKNKKVGPKILTLMPEGSDK